MAGAFFGHPTALEAWLGFVFLGAGLGFWVLGFGVWFGMAVGFDVLGFFLVQGLTLSIKVAQKPDIRGSFGPEALEYQSFGG